MRETTLCGEMQVHELRANFPLGCDSSWTTGNCCKDAPPGLTLPGSLTKHLKERCEKFEVIVLGQKSGQTISADEQDLLDLRCSTAMIREVLLVLDGTPWIYARSGLPDPSSTDAAGGFASVVSLGTRPLAELLFSSEGITRSAFEVQRFGPGSVPHYVAAVLGQCHVAGCGGRGHKAHEGGEDEVSHRGTITTTTAAAAAANQGTSSDPSSPSSTSSTSSTSNTNTSSASDTNTRSTSTRSTNTNTRSTTRSTSDTTTSSGTAEQQQGRWRSQQAQPQFELADSSRCHHEASQQQRAQQQQQHTPQRGERQQRAQQQQQQQQQHTPQRGERSEHDLPGEAAVLWGRRSLFTDDSTGDRLFVMETFLPAAASLLRLDPVQRVV